MGMGKNISPKHLKDLIITVDDDNSGTLRYREYVDFLLVILFITVSTVA